jgi:hypothetical protein
MYCPGALLEVELRNERNGRESREDVKERRERGNDLEDVKGG